LVALDMADLLPVGEIARRSGVASSALRFYEQRGLNSSERAGSGSGALTITPNAPPPE
jgi:MerR family transcriptional regulator, redox-sensitive transcriptional activator SoxR